jgi:accessory gene regulator B
MIESIANKLAVKIKAANPNNTSSVEVMSFALIVILGTGGSIIFSILISSLFGHLMETCIVLFSFAILRFFSGGFHFKSAEKCMLTSIIGSVLIPFINLSDFVNTLLLIITFIIILLLSPIGVNQSRIFTKKHYPILKTLSLLIVASNFLIKSELLTLTFFAQSISMLILLKGGEAHEENN